MAAGRPSNGRKRNLMANTTSSVGSFARVRILFRPLALALVLLALLSCNTSRRKVIGMVPKATSHLFWVSVQAGAMAAGQALNVEVLWNGPATETDYSRQIEIVD